MKKTVECYVGYGRLGAGFGLAVGLVLIAALGLQASPPTALDIYLTTLRDQPVEVVLIAEHPGVIDPADPPPITFGILEGPYDGEPGGISDVTYEAGDDPGDAGRALVRLTYTPRRGFVGSDIIIYFAATDPDGESSVGTVRIDVVRPPVPPPSLSGSLRLNTTFNSETEGVQGLTSSLSLVYTVDIFRFESYSSFSLAGWTSQRFVGSFPLGDTIRVRSTLSFNPAAPSFTSFLADTRLALVGLTLTHRLYLAGTPAASYTHLQASGRMDDLSFTSTWRFDLPDIKFQSWILDTRFPLPVCGLSARSRFRFDKSGFDYISFTVGDILLPWFEYPTFAVYLRTTTTFTTTDKTVDLSVLLRSRWECCVRLFVDLATEDSDSTFSGLDIFGFEIRMTLANGIELRSATSFDPARNSRVTGYRDFFEVLTLTGPVPACCGAPGRWRVAFYFHDEPGVSLFGWGQTEIDYEFSLNENMRFSTALTVRNDSPVWELSVGLRLHW